MFVINLMRKFALDFAFLLKYTPSLYYNVITKNAKRFYTVKCHVLLILLVHQKTIRRNYR